MATRDSVNLSLPRSLKQLIEEQVGRRGFSTTSEYLRHLVRQDLQGDAAFVSTREDLREKLLQGLKGRSRVMTRSRWDALRTKARKRLAAIESSQRRSA